MLAEALLWLSTQLAYSNCSCWLNSPNSSTHPVLPSCCLHCCQPEGLLWLPAPTQVKPQLQAQQPTEQHRAPAYTLCWCNACILH
jgi:hypothetical protein